MRVEGLCQRRVLDIHPQISISALSTQPPCQVGAGCNLSVRGVEAARDEPHLQPESLSTLSACQIRSPNSNQITLPRISAESRPAENHKSVSRTQTGVSKKQTGVPRENYLGSTKITRHLGQRSHFKATHGKTGRIDRQTEY